MNSEKHVAPEYLRIKQAFKGASDAEIARRLQITKQAVSQWKSGETKPDSLKMIRTSQITEVPLEWLLTGDEKYLTGMQQPQDIIPSGQPDIANNNNYESLFREVLKLNPEHRAKFDAIMEYAEHQVEQMLKEEQNEAPRRKGKKS